MRIPAGGGSAGAGCGGWGGLVRDGHTPGSARTPSRPKIAGDEATWARSGGKTARSTGTLASSRSTPSSTSVTSTTGCKRPFVEAWGGGLHAEDEAAAGPAGGAALGRT
eukprot:scaffold20371_cov102-Isochrysis_galbana.AAC.2